MTLHFGNPSYDSMQLIRTSELLRVWGARGIFAPLVKQPYPDERGTKRELWMLVGMTTSLTPDRLAYCTELDKDLFGVMSRYLSGLGKSVSAEEIKKMCGVYEPIIDYLKAIYNRPRPFQTAGQYGIPLYPRIGEYSGESSYPGGHTLFSLFFYHMYKMRYPELANDLLKFAMDTKTSREQLGVHYPSDGVFSFRIYRYLAPYMTVHGK